MEIFHRMFQRRFIHKFNGFRGAAIFAGGQLAVDLAAGKVDPVRGTDFCQIHVTGAGLRIHRDGGSGAGRFRVNTDGRYD